MKDTIILPIRKEYADAIFNREKKFEYRKSLPANPVKKILVYEARGCKKVVGEFEVEEIIEASPSRLWKITKDFSGLWEKDFFEYFKNKDTAYAYRISKPQRYKIPKSLSEFNLSTAPQNYIWI